MPLRAESDLDFFSRRAMEESRAATNAGSRMASNAHRHMAVAYAVRMRDEHLAAEALAEMLDLIGDVDDADVGVSARHSIEGGASD